LEYHSKQIVYCFLSKRSIQQIASTNQGVNMNSESQQYKFAKSNTKDLNFSGLNRLRKQEKLNQKIAAQCEILNDLRSVSDKMHEAGASEPSIRLALRGRYEYMKATLGQKLEKSAEELIKNPDSRFDGQRNQAPVTFLSDVETQQVDWLWQRRIPLGKITILDGDPGMGKSLLSIFIAACVSTGHPMPDGTPGKQGKVILIAPEDAAEDTIKPRVEAAGGDPSQVLLLDNIEQLNLKDTKKIKFAERPFSLSQDMKILENAIKQLGIILVVIDPFMAVLGRNIDSSRDQDVREVLTPLAQVAERTGCAFLIIRHLNKGSSDNILYRGSGSIGIIAVARIGLLVAHDPDDEQKRVFATIKNNLSKIAPNLSYQIAENEHGAPYIQWLGENHHTTSTLLNPGTNMSFERQAIMKALKEAASPLDTKEISELTGLKYESLRTILSRMQNAKDIIRPHRGKYTTPNHPSLIHNNTELNEDTNATTATSATTATTATNITYDLDPSDE
jgi:archaellum biogenesis ATPase FlaH